MKLTISLKLKPTPEQQQLLLETLETANRAANEISRQAWQRQTFGPFALHRLCYQKIRQRFKLSAQMVVRLTAKVADAYKLDQKAERTFNSRGSIAYDDRILTYGKEGVSIWTIGGRQYLPFVCGERERCLLASRQGESDLIYRDGQWYLHATVNYLEPPTDDPDDVLGIDLGVNNLACDSDGNTYSGSYVKNLRRRHRKIRKRLQSKGTKSAKRLLKKRSRKEKRFAKDINHQISKQVVEAAKRTQRAIVLEDLKDIRSRIRATKAARADLHSWGFYQLRTFIEYKARMVGVLVILVDPRNSSRECSRCGYVHKSNRPDQATFRCCACSHAAHADINAAQVLRNRGRAVRQPAARGATLVVTATFSRYPQATGF